MSSINGSEFLLACSFGKVFVKSIFQNDTYPTVVLLHDSLGCVTLWRDFPEKLAESMHWNVLIYDRIGYGKSDPFPDGNRGKDYMDIEANRLNEILDLLKINKVLLFGHSDGGTISLLFAAYFPEKCLGVITEGAHIYVDELTLKGVSDARENYFKTDIRKRLEKYHGENTVPLFFAWVDTWLAPFYRDWNISEKLAQIRCPVLALQGEHDEFGLPEQAQDIARFSGEKASYSLLPYCGHNPHKENLEETMRATKNWISIYF